MRCHTARSVKQTYLRHENVPLLHWPEDSSDMNPIENIWELVKREIANETINTNIRPIKRLIRIWNHYQQMQNTVRAGINILPSESKH